MDLHLRGYNNNKLNGVCMRKRTKIIIAAGVVLLGYGVMTLQMPQSPSVSDDSNPATTTESKAVSNGINQSSTTQNTGSTTQEQRQIEPSVPYSTPIASESHPSTPTAVINGTEYPLRLYKPVETPNDPLAGQWGAVQAQLPQAWEIPRGNNSTLLAVIDTGFALQHEEFAGRWHSNDGETGAASSEAASLLNCADRSLALDANCNLVDDNHDGTVDNETGAVSYQNPSQLNCTDRSSALAKSCNRIDDDANGLVDDVSGWDFINGDPSPQAGQLHPSGTGTTHGTKVAGLAAATGNNNVGIAGVDWGTTILPIQALDDDSYGDTRSVGNAINYAVAEGADVISISLGTTLPDAYVEQAVRAATAAGVVVVAAAGNDGCDCMVYPANYPETIAVGALDASNQRASFSSYGRNLDVLAPGSNMTSATWNSTNQSSLYVSGIGGTSFATPMVSGMITRLLSQQPQTTPLQLAAAIAENTQLLSLTESAPRTDAIGFGTLDAHKSTLRMATPYAPKRLYSFANVNAGDYLDSLNPTDIAGVYTPYQCAAGVRGSTALYKLTKDKEVFYTISVAEMRRAESLGYVGTLLAYSCLLQPHDTPESIRKLNTKREF